MELSDLTHDERLALVALVEAVIASDATVSEDEQTHIATLAAVFGDEAYRHCFHSRARTNFTFPASESFVICPNSVLPPLSDSCVVTVSGRTTSHDDQTTVLNGRVSRSR